MKKIMFGISFLVVIMISSCSPEMSQRYDLGITSNECIDLDGDGFGDECPLGIDCNDEDDSRLSPLQSIGYKGIQAKSIIKGYAQDVMLAWRSVIVSVTRTLKFVGNDRPAAR